MSRNTEPRPARAPGRPSETDFWNHRSGFGRNILPDEHAVLKTLFEPARTKLLPGPCPARVRAGLPRLHEIGADQIPGTFHGLSDVLMKHTWWRFVAVTWPCSRRGGSFENIFANRRFPGGPVSIRQAHQAIDLPREPGRSFHGRPFATWPHALIESRDR